jgi:L-lactate dehydrogenase complex protein LldE
LRVALFVPCYVDMIYPQVGVSVVRVLRRLGVEVAYSEGQTCCGQPAFNSGFFQEARNVARHLLDVFEKDPADYVVCPSGSCTAMVSYYYPVIFEDRKKERERSEALGRRVGSSRISGERAGGWGRRSRRELPGQGRLPHGLPSATGAGILEEPRELLRGVEGLELWTGRTRSCAAVSGGRSR